MGSIEMLRPTDIAEQLGVTTGRVYQLISEGALPAVRRGRAIRIPRAAWERWLAEQAELALSALRLGAPRGAS